MNHQGTKLLTTSRLILRPFRLDDADMMYKNWSSNDNVTKYLTWPTHTSVDVTKNIINSWVKTYDDLRTYHYAIVYKKDNEVIGDISIVNINEETKTAELGWCLSEEYWGMGIMTEAAIAIRDYLFDDVGFDYVMAKHDINNPKSGRVMEKMSMKYLKNKKDINNQGVCEVAVYRMHKDDR